MPPVTPRFWFWPLLIALAACVWVLCAIDPTGEFPHAPQGPGLTLDEGFNVEHGVVMADRLLAGDLPGYAEASGKLPDHPPLGRIWIGLCHEASLVFVGMRFTGPFLFSVGCARPASALAFAALIFLVGYSAGRWYGLRAGAFASLALLCMPRVFGHAHIASLEMCTCLTYVTVLLYLTEQWGGDRPPSPRTALIGGALWGLAFLTKIQAVLIPPVVGLWALVIWRRKALLPLVLWGAAGWLAFFAAWPWLWSDPVEHVLKFLGRATVRTPVQVSYWGQTWVDKQVPWHYPWVLFLTTIPVGLLATGVWGLAGNQRPVWKMPRESLLLGGLLLPLIVFSIPGVAVYDGARLFLMAFPLWAIFAGLGADRAVTWLESRARPGATSYLRRPFVLPATIVLFWGPQAIGLVTPAPCHLSYYNALVGGLAGADRLGFQTTYWGDSLTRDFLSDAAQSVPVGSRMQLLPVMHQYQLQLLQQCPALLQRRIELVPFAGEGPENEGYILVMQRKDYVPPEFRSPSADLVPLAEMRRSGVLLAALYKLRLP